MASAPPGTPSNAALRRMAVEREARAIANRLAAGCQNGIRLIEALPHWHCSRELTHWHAALSTARTALQQTPPPPQPRTQAEREIDTALAELVASAPPSPAVPGGGEGGIGGADAPLAAPAHSPSWADVLGDR